VAVICRAYVRVVAEFPERPLEDGPYRYLWIDARWCATRRARTRRDERTRTFGSSQRADEAEAVDAVGMGRRTRSSPRPGKSVTWRRGPACSQQLC
jgi:hypothetical protein